MSVFIALIMLASGFAVYLGNSQTSTIKDHGITFKIDIEANQYVGKINDQKMGFSFLPTDLQDIPVDEGVASSLRSAEVLILSFDPALSPKSLQSTSVVRLDLAELTGIPSINAVTTPSASYSLPVFTCANATALMPIVTFKEAKDPSITKEGSCIILAANGTSFIALRDRLVYDYYGVYEKK